MFLKNPKATYITLSWLAAISEALNYDTVLALRQIFENFFDPSGLFKNLFTAWSALHAKAQL
jgi:hypothetical protein